MLKPYKQNKGGQYMEIQRLHPMAYRLHDFVVANCVGEKNAMNADNLAFTLGITTRQLRKHRAEVNGDLSEFHKKILTSKNGYYVALADEPIKAQKQYKAVAWRKIRQGLKLLNEGKRLLEAINNDGAVRINISGHQKEIIEVYVNGNDLWKR